MRVILAEKPSVAKDIAKALGSVKSQQGYYMLPNGDYVTYAVGHLIQSDDNALTPQENGRPKLWNFDDLPIFPPNFQYRPVFDKNLAAQLNVIKRLLSSADEVVIATDAGREGELIARHILNYANYGGAIKRLWTSKALTPDVVRDEMKKLRDGMEFDSLYYAGLARDQADWLVGINLTRAATLRSYHRDVWKIGRVQTPTLKLIVDRDIERENFKSVPYALVKASFQKGNTAYEGMLLTRMPARDTRDDDDTASRLTREKAEEIVKKLAGVPTGTVVVIEQEEKRRMPDLLHSLTSLQREANTEYGLSAQATLNIVQRLYEEKKAVSYPRTDARHMSPSNKQLAQDSLRKIGYEHLTPVVNKVGKRVFDDAKLTDHHALIPLAPLPAGCSTEEVDVYNLIFRKFVGAFMPDYRYSQTSVLTDLGGYKFLSKGVKVLQPGWMELYKGPAEQMLPPLVKGDKVSNKKVWKVDMKTKPPQVHTEASILRLMERFGLGTPATRAAILEKIKSTGYADRQNKALVSTPKGRELITRLKSGITSPEMTAEWEKKLGEIYSGKKGQAGYRGFLDEIRLFVSGEVAQIKSMSAIGQQLPPPAPRKSFSPGGGKGGGYSKGGGFRKGGYSKSKSGYSKSGYSSYPKR
ncbi:MAG: DNA topoisomerase [Syntrophorhabdaceae bacterium]|nr:DNA topoisomerase [Syntrophorhabdaceae bacterium]